MHKIYPLLQKVILSLCLLFSVIYVASGQRTIHGRVTDADTGEGVIGANIVVVGTTIGTVSDFDGSYTVTVPEGATTLAFSYTGYNTVEVAITGSDELNVALGEGKLLDEVVLIGYGTVRREDATGAVQSVSSEQFNKGAITSAQELIAGKMPGVVVTTDPGPGGGATIRIRGESSLTATRDPLIVIDGVPVENTVVSGGRNILNAINPNDIESISVLKDASSAAIYGNRGAAGVILITTKKGKVGDKLKIGYSGNVSFGKAENYVDVLNAQEYRDLVYSRFDSNDVDDRKIINLMGDASTDWQQEIFQSAVSHDHNLYLSGAMGTIPARLSLGYTNQEGILLTDQYSRYTAGLNLNPGFLENTLQLNIHLKAMFADNHFADRGAIGNSLNFDPTQSVYDTSATNRYGGYTTWMIANGNPNNLAPTNPLALLDLRDDDSKETRYIANFSADYRFPFLTALRANLNLAYDKAHGEGTVVVDTLASFAFDAIYGGGVNNVYEQDRTNSLLELFFNYGTRFGESGIDLLAGYSWQHFEVDNFFRNSDAAGTPEKTTTGSDPGEYYLLSLYGRANYNFDERFYATVSLRRDGTSRFAPDNRWGLFPAVALAYKLIDNESNNFNFVKVRAGWGITGQQDIGTDYYAYLARYQLGNERANYQFGNDYIRTLRPNGYDANIKWEETKTYNLGFDFSIIRDRLSGNIDLYQRLTKDLLNRVPVPAGTNLTNFITTNVGNIENKGVELGLSIVPVLTQKVSLEFGANISFNKNEITRLTATDDPEYEGVLTGGIAGGVGSTIQIHTVGFAPRSFFVYEQVYNEDGTLQEGVFADRNNDGIVNAADKYRFNSPAADWTAGLSSRLEIGNFDLTFGARASVGNYVYNNVQTDMGWLGRINNTTGVLWNINQSAVDLNVEEQGNLTLSDHYVKKADFLKMDHITAGYNFHDVIGEYLRLYVTAQNPFVLTSYDGLDPEIFSGIDNSTYPRARTFVFGLNVEF